MSYIIDVILETNEGECYQFTASVKDYNYTDDSSTVDVQIPDKLVLQPLTGNLEDIADIAEPQYQFEFNQQSQPVLDEVTAIEMQLWCDVFMNLQNITVDEGSLFASAVVSNFRKYFKLESDT